VRDNTKPFSQEIMDEPMPTYYITPKIAFFIGIEDPKNHLTAFNAQMIISGETDVIRCEMFMDIFTGTTLQLFSGIPDGHITSFSQIFRMFREQFSVNKVKPPRLHNLFGVRQREGESLKDYLNRFCTVTVRLQTHDEDMMISAFEQGIVSRPFTNSLIKNPTKTFSEVRERVVAHIEAEEVVLRKNDNSHSRQPKSKENNRAQPLRVNETSAQKRMDSRYVPYVARKDELEMKAIKDSTARPKFQVSYKELLSMPGVVDKLKFPHKTDRNLGSRRDTWCEFHKAFGHNVK